jgi:hypothetical protein
MRLFGLKQTTLLERLLEMSKSLYKEMVQKMRLVKFQTVKYGTLPMRKVTRPRKRTKRLIS